MENMAGSAMEKISGSMGAVPILFCRVSISCILHILSFLQNTAESKAIHAIISNFSPDEKGQKGLFVNKLWLFLQRGRGPWYNIIEYAPRSRG